MAFVSNYLKTVEDPTYNDIEEYKEDEENQNPDELLQEKYISSVLQKLNNRVIGTKEFISLHNEDQFMYPELGFDIKAKKTKTILKKILNREYKSEIPSYVNKHMANKLFKNRLYSRPIGFVPTTKPKPDSKNPFDTLVPSKTTITKKTNSNKKKIFTSIDALNDNERYKMANSILGNDFVDITLNNPEYEKIIPEIIKETDTNLNSSENELIRNYLEKINIEKDIIATENINRPFLDNKPEVETYNEMVLWDANNSDNNKPIINIIQQSNQNNNQNDRNEISTPKNETNVEIPITDSENIQDLNIENNNDDASKNKENKENRKIQTYDDVFNIQYNTLVSTIDEIPYRENKNIDIDQEIEILEKKVKYIDSIIKKPVKDTIINEIEDEYIKPKSANEVVEVSTVINEDLKDLNTVNTSIGFEDKSKDINILYLDENNIEKEWSIFTESLNESSFSISSADVTLVYNFVFWMVTYRERFYIEFVASTNPYIDSHLELIHNGVPTNTTVGDLLLNIGSHQLTPIKDPIWDTIEINNDETLSIYENDEILDIERLTVFKMISGYYNRSVSVSYKIIFHSYKKILPKVEKQINAKISGLDELLNTLNDNDRNSNFIGTCKLLDNIRFQTHNFYFDDYSKIIIQSNKTEIERKYNNNLNKNEYIARLYRNLFKNNASWNDSSTLVEMIFYNYFDGDIASFLGISNSEIFVNTNNEIGEMLNEINRRSLVTDTECYTQFTMSMVTMIIATVYLTFKSFTLEMTEIQGSKEIIENLCITIRCIKIQMLSMNINNDNIYTVVTTMSNTLKSIHENRITEYESIIRNRVEIERQYNTNTEIMDYQTIPEEFKTNIAQNNIDSIPNNLREVPSLENMITYKIEKQLPPEAEVVPMYEEKIFDNIDTSMIVSNTENLAQGINDTIVVPITEDNDAILNIDENMSEVSKSVSILNKKEGIDDERRTTQRYDRLLKNLIKDVSVKGDENKDKVSDIVFSHIRDTKTKLNKGDLKKLKEKLTKEIVKVRTIENKNNNNNNSDIPDGKTSLKDAGIVVGAKERNVIDEIFTTPSNSSPPLVPSTIPKTSNVKSSSSYSTSNLPDLSEVIDETTKKRISKIRNKVIKSMGITEVTSEINNKLKNMITGFLDDFKDRVISNKKISEIIVDIIKAEGTDLIRQRNPSVVQPYRNKNKTDNDIKEQTYQIKKQSDIKNNRKKLLQITNTIDINSGEVDDVITIIEDKFKDTLDTKSEYSIRKAIKREFDKEKTAPADEIADKMISKVNKSIKKSRKKTIRKMAKSIVVTLRDEDDIDPELTTKHRDLIYSVLKKKYKNNDRRVPERISRKLIQKYKEYLRTNINTAKKIKNITQPTVPINLIEEWNY